MSGASSQASFAETSTPLTPLLASQAWAANQTVFSFFFLLLEAMEVAISVELDVAGLFICVLLKADTRGPHARPKAWE
jgi:hypothetical protein